MDPVKAVLRETRKSLADKPLCIHLSVQQVGYICATFLRHMVSGSDPDPETDSVLLALADACENKKD